MTPSLHFLIDLTLAYIALIAVFDILYYLAVLPGGTISRSVTNLARVHRWLPWAYLAGLLALVGLGFVHFFGPIYR